MAPAFKLLNSELEEKQVWWKENGEAGANVSWSTFWAFLKTFYADALLWLSPFRT